MREKVEGIARGRPLELSIVRTGWESHRHRALWELAQCLLREVKPC